MPKPLAIDYVSPLPPVRSGISDYSVDLLAALAPLCDLRVVRVPGLPVNEDRIASWNPVAADQLGSTDRLALYQMGNNEYHAEVMRLALRIPGVVTLHDVVLHHLLVEMTLGRGALDPYLKQLAADHGWVGRAAADARRWGELGQAAMFGLSANRSLLRSQRGVLVHSEWAADRIRQEDPSVRVRVVPMAIPLPTPPDSASGLEFRLRYGLPETAPLIGSFGFQTPIKRTDAVIRALALPGMEDVHLLVGGELSPVLDFAALARECGVSGRVHLTGFLDFDEFGAAIAACDLCVNLRYPTAGETSASLLRVLALGRPAIVSDYAHAGELPDDVVLKVPLGSGEAEALAARVGGLMRAREGLKEMGLQARAFIARQHDPALSAAAVLEACRELAYCEPPGAANAELPAPTTLVWRQVPGLLRVSGAELPWRAGTSRRLSIALRNSSQASWLATRRGSGGVMLQLQWREDPWSSEVRTRWLELPHDLLPGESHQFDCELRRPIGASMLVVEPHIQDVAGFSALGGPRWVEFF